MRHPRATQRPNHRGYLEAANKRFEALLTEIVDAASRGADPQRLRPAWSRMERGFRANLRGQERWLFRELQKAHPVEVGELQQAHDQIRKLLSEVGIIVDRHVLRGATVRALLALVRAYRVQQQRTVCLWAPDEVSRPAHREMLKQIVDFEDLLAPLGASELKDIDALGSTQTGSGVVAAAP